jgi:hypothetical protein
VATGTTVACVIQPDNTVNAGDVVSVELRGLTNPSTTGSGTVSVSTTSDLVATTTSVTITSAQSVHGLSATPASTAAGVLTNWTFGFTSSSTGQLAPWGATVTLTLPTGTSLGSFTGGLVTDTTNGAEFANCSVVSGTTVSCFVSYNQTLNAGDAFSVTLDGVTNPTTTGPATVSVSTSADTKLATTSVTITGVVCSKLSGKASGKITIKKCTPKSAANKLASGSGSSLFSGGTLTWKKSHQSTVIGTSATTPSGHGAGKSGSTERDITGSVSGGSSTYTHSGDYVSLRVCQSSSGALSLVKGTRALL